jgi:AcrR family transcriptional regulator
MVDDTRQKLMDAAGPIFADRGYQATTVREICTSAGVNLALVNYHFGDKEKLYAEAVRHASHSCMERIPLPTWPDGATPQQKLHDYVTMFLNRVAVQCDPAWHSQLIMRELQHPTSACATFVSEFARPSAMMLDSIVIEMLPPDFPDRDRRLICFSIVGQILHYWSARPVIVLLIGEEEFRSYDVATLAQHITDFSLAAIRSASARFSQKKTTAPKKKVRT